MTVSNPVAAPAIGEAVECLAKIGHIERMKCKGSAASTPANGQIAVCVTHVYREKDWQPLDKEQLVLVYITDIID